MFGYNEKRIVDLEETKAKDFIKQGQKDAIAEQELQKEAERAKGPASARARWARIIVLIVILAVVAFLLAQIFIFTQPAKPPNPLSLLGAKALTA